MHHTVNVEKTDRYRSFTQIKLPYGVIGRTHQILILKLWVQILLGQQIFFIILNYLYEKYITMKNDKEALIKLMESVNPDFKYKVNESGMSEVPTELESVNNDILRAAIMSEMDAINLYEQLAAKTDNEEIKKVLLDVAKEEKTHIGEFQSLLAKIDPEYSEELIKGNEEVGEIVESLNSEENNKGDFETFFRQLIRSYGYEPSQIDEMPEEERRQFFDELDKKWTSDKEGKYLDEE